MSDDLLGQKENSPKSNANNPPGKPQDYLLALWSYRWLILLITALSGAVALAASWMMDPVYQARSTLIVRPAPFSTDLKPVPLSVESYRTILASDFIRKKLKDEAHQRGLIGEGARSPTWTTSVDIHQETATSRPGERGFIPLIDLIVEAHRAELAAEIANLWAEVFVRENSDLTAAGKQDTVTFIETQFPAVSETLDDQEAQLKDREDYFNNGKVKLENEWTQRILDLRLETETAITEFDNETEQLKTEFINETERLRASHEQETERLRLEFLSRWKPDLLKTELKIKEEKQAVFKDEELDTALEIQTQKQTLEELQGQIQDHPQMLILSKAITDEALWENIAATNTSKALQELARLKLNTQELNPTHLELLGRLIDAQVSVNTLTAKREYLKNEIERLETEIDSLKTKVAKKDLELFVLLKEREVALKTTLESRRMQLQTLTRERLLERVKLEEKGNQRLAVLTRAKDNNLDEFKRRRTLELGQLNRKTESVRNTYTMLAEKHESAQLAKAEEESDVKIGARAVVRDRPVSPRPLANAGTAMTLGLVFSITLAFVLNHVRGIGPTADDFSPPRESQSPARSFSVSQPAVRTGK